MTNEQLKAFLAVVEQGSFRAAAAAIFKTQPSISAAVKALELQFAVSLFDRDSYRPELTPEGKVFYRQAKLLIKQANRLEMLGHQLASADMPLLSISLSAMCALPPVLEKIKLFTTEHEKMRLQINTEHLSGVLEQLQLEKTDLAIGPNIGLGEQHEFVQISQINMLTVAAPGYLSIQPGELISHQQLRHKPHILISDTGSLAPFDHVNVLLGGQRWYVNDYQMKKALLVSAMGWARMPEHIITAELQSGALITVQVENFNSQSQVPMYLIKLKNHTLNSLAKAFWDQLSVT